MSNQRLGQWLVAGKNGSIWKLGVSHRGAGFLIGLSLLFLTACGGGDSGSSKKAETTSAPQTQTSSASTSAGGGVVAGTETSITASV
ncbi:MAG TPA: hypothetical protein HPQ00_03500, partial [Magnetococcales bacterium]|nr:hypothetical protein [Magnetococcales bacterium]